MPPVRTQRLVRQLALALPCTIAALAAAPAAAQTAPAPVDICFSDGNAINEARPGARSCAATTVNGSFGSGRAASANGRDVSAASVGNGAGSTGWSNQGWTNSATASAGGSGWTSADLTTGWLKSSSTTVTPPGAGEAQAFHLARFGDTLTFTNTSGAPRTVGFGYAFDGAFIDADASPSSNGYVWFSFDERNAPGREVRFAASNSFFSGNMRTTFDASGAYAHNFFGGTAADRQLSRFGVPGDGEFGGRAFVGFVLPTGTSTIDFAFTLRVDCRVYDSACAFGNTSALSFDPLPEGVSFTSESGVFLTSAIPEPGAWALMLAGMAVVVARRRQQASAT
jgi:hypothetical protein